MMRRLMVGGAIVFLAVACSKKDGKDTASSGATADEKPGDVSETQADPDTTGNKAAEGAPGAVKDGPEDPTASSLPGFSQAAGRIGDAFKSIESKVPRLDPMPPPLETQLGFKTTRLKFLGWTEDGRRFAIIATHGLDEGELGGSNQIRLRQVHDALTGNVIESFRVERSQDREVSKSNDLRKAWKQASSRKAWKTWSAENTLVGPKAFRKSPSGSAKFEAERDGRPPHGSKFKIKPTSRGFATTWTNFTKEPRKGSSRAPRTKITLVGSNERWESISYRAPFKYEHVFEAVDDPTGPRVEGRLEAYWSPLADRVVWIMTQKMENVHEEMQAQDARFYVRAVGPQIKILNAGVGDDAARKAAEILAFKGLPPTVLETADEPSPVSKIYYRGDAGRKVAEQVSKHVPGKLPVEALEKDGWIDVIVVLGP